MTAIWNLCGPDFLIETAQATAHMRKERPHGDMSIHTSTYVRWVTMYWITGIVTLMIVSVLLAAGTLGAGEARPSPIRKADVPGSADQARLERCAYPYCQGRSRHGSGRRWQAGRVQERNKWVHLCADGRPQRADTRSDVHGPRRISMVHVADEQ